MAKSDDLRAMVPDLAERIVALQYGRESDRWGQYGEVGRAKSVRDSGYHLAYLAEAWDADDPSLFAEYVAWVKALFANLGFAESVLPNTLACTREVLAESLPAPVRERALAILDAGIESLRAAPTDLPSLIGDTTPLDDLTHAYLDALLRGDRQTASRTILDAVGQGMSVRDIYLQVFQRSQREIGRLWQTNRISVAQEHYCTAATQLIMSQLYPYIFTGTRKAQRLVVACVDGELHEIGARMVADFLEMEGWDTYFLGANTPPESVLRTVEERHAEVLALSATMTFHVSRVSDLIDGLRATPALSGTSVLVGGYPFNISPDLWRRIGADGYAPDAASAVAEVARIALR